MLVVPELGGDEEVLALEAGDLSKGLLHALGDLLLVLVDLGEIEVLVTGLEGLVDADGHLTGGGLPCLQRAVSSVAISSVSSSIDGLLRSPGWGSCVQRTG